MALDTTISGVASTAYADVSYADAYLSFRNFSEDWFSASVTSKEAALAWATRLLDQLKFDGQRSTRQQALRWPRFSVLDRDGFLYESTTLPKVIKDANVEYALYLLREDRTLDTGAIGLNRVQVGPLQVEFADTSATVKATPDSVTALIRHTLLSASGSACVTTVRT